MIYIHNDQDGARAALEGALDQMAISAAAPDG